TRACQAGTRGGSSSSALHGGPQIALCHSPRRPSAEKQSGEHREAECREKYPCVKFGLLKSGHPRGTERRDTATCGQREQKSQEAAAKRKQQAFRQALTYNAAARSSQCAPHGDLGFAIRAPRQQEIREIGAGKQQDEGHRAKKQPES